MTTQTLNRRKFLQASSAGLLVVGFSFSELAQAKSAPGLRDTKSVAKEQLDSWLQIDKNNRITVYVGKVDLGTGTKTALSQIAAEELSVPYNSIEMIMGDTGTTPDQWITGAALTIQQGGSELRLAAASARIALLRRAAEQWQVPVESLEVKDGVIRQTGNSAREAMAITVDPRSNTLILRAANPARVALVKSLVTKLDQPGGTNPSGNIHVVYLKNADATKLATTLRAALNGQSTGATGTTTAANTPTSPMASPLANTTTGSTLGSTTPSSGSATGGQIQADTATNSLIITAPEPQYRQLRAVIDMLDQRRAQVMVESLIAEVNADRAAQMGIQWQTAVGEKGSAVGIIGTNFNNNLSTSIGSGNIINAAGGSSTALTTLGNGLNLGTAKQINGTYVLSSLATFLQQNGQGNVLSTPTLLTLDNEEAKIVVGQNVPFVTGQYTNNNTNNGSVNPFQTVERKDVGLTLKVKPQISETGTVKLTIFQEVSSVVPNSVGSTTGLITNKRSIESNVLVDDGSIIVLGGLLSDEYSGAGSQVPLFGDIPVIGWLFKSESRSRTKKNLMVFLRPVVVRDAAASDALSNNRYQQMMGLQQSAQPGFNPVLGSGNSPVLPPAPVVTPKETPKETPNASEDRKADSPQPAAPTATPAQ